MNIFKKWREPMNALTHLIPLIIFIPIVFYLVFKGYMQGGIYSALAFLVFAFSVIGLYSASTIYHMLPAKEKTIAILKKIDHMMIFVLIAGTYTPICLISLKGVWGYSMFAIVWIIAIFGIFLKLFWIKAPRWLSTSIYVIMGWVAVVAFYPIIKAIHWSGILLLILGGILYTIGAVIYATKHPKINFKYLGFHEIFHLFVIAGSVCYIVFMFVYVL